MLFHIETEQEDDGRWLAEVVELPGAMTYGATAREALRNVQALALQILADKLQHGELQGRLARFLSRIAKRTGLLPSDLG